MIHTKKGSSQCILDFSRTLKGSRKIWHLTFHPVKLAVGLGRLEATMYRCVLAKLVIITIENTASKMNSHISCRHAFSDVWIYAFTTSKSDWNYFMCLLLEALNQFSCYKNTWYFSWTGLDQMNRYIIVSYNYPEMHKVFQYN